MSAIKVGVLTPLDIKELISEQHPIAKFKSISQGIITYEAFIVIDDCRVGFGFQIPITSVGNKFFRAEMEASLLLSWLNPTIVYFETIQDQL